jgi:uncharacterized protein (TIGR03067 family)
MSDGKVLVWGIAKRIGQPYIDQDQSQGSSRNRSRKVKLMNRLVLVVCLLVFASITIACGGGGPADHSTAWPSRSTQSPIIGEWRVSRMEIGGVRQNDEGEFLWKFRESRVNATVPGVTDSEFKWREDPAANPARLTISRIEGDGDTVLLGIYKIDGDTLHLVVGPRGGYPERFGTTRGNVDEIYFEMKRVTK